MPLDLPEIIDEAMSQVGGEQAKAVDLKGARRAINLLLAEWQNRGLRLWKVASGTVTTADGTSTYALETDLVDILDVTISGDDGRWMERISRSEYERRDWSGQKGKPSQFYLDRQKAPTIWFYPQPNAALTVDYHYMATLSTIAHGGSTLDMPDRFIPVLTAGLAYRLARARMAPTELRNELKNEYEQQFNMARIEDRERVPVRFSLGAR